ncbi:helix-turn-helix domain-containing protein [Streptomyces sp. NPDC058603]|uniref:helix-turn-helix domain-containing protein n=1 Tax=Streptomyces sp. NPDC058603 TaxID=3346551 RepID=UPI00366080D2
MTHRLRTDMLRSAARELGDETGYAIAQRTGIAETTVSRLLRGVTQPGVKTLLIFRRVYGIPLDESVEETAA